MNKRVSLGVTIGMMLLVAAFTFSITFNIVTAQVNDRITALKEREDAQRKYAEIDREVRENYSGTIDDTQLLDSVARGYLAGIGDPYAAYYDAKTYERMSRALENSVADIGAVLQANPDGYLAVVEVYPDSPALAAGILAGDLIVKVDNIDLTPENSATLLESIRGESGTKVFLTIRSENVDRTEELTRREVVVPSVTSRMIGDTMVGYLLIEEFNINTPDQFKRELERVMGQGAQSVIFDVRDNTGGRLSSATRMLDRLLPAGQIVSSQDKTGAVNVLATSDASDTQIPMVVLVNGGTASSAEVFAQVLKDYDKARIVGATTTGKGVMQSVIKLSDGSAIEITTGKLITPSGDSFDGVGVKPDYDVALEDDWRLLTEEYDLQLKKAIEVAVSMHLTSNAQPGTSSRPEQSSQASQPAEESSSQPEESSLPEEEPGQSEAEESSLPEESPSQPVEQPPEESDPPEESSSQPEEASPQDPSDS